MKSRRQISRIPQIAETLETRTLLTDFVGPLPQNLPIEIPDEIKIPEPQPKLNVEESPFDYNIMDHEIHNVDSILGNQTSGFQWFSTEGNSNVQHLETGTNTVIQSAASVDFTAQGFSYGGHIETFDIIASSQTTAGRIREPNVETIDGRRVTANLDIHIEGHGLGLFLINTNSVATETNTFSASYFGTETTTRTQQSEGNLFILVYGNYDIHLTVETSTAQMDEVYAANQLAGRGSSSIAQTNLDVQCNWLTITQFHDNEIVTDVYQYQGLQPDDSSFIIRSAQSKNDLYTVSMWSGITITGTASRQTYSGTLEGASDWIRTDQISGTLDILASRWNIVWGQSQTSANGANNTPGTTWDTIRINLHGEYHGGTTNEDSYSPLGTKAEQNQALEEIFAHGGLADDLFGL